MPVTVPSNGLWINKNGKKICYNPWTHFEVNNPNGDVTICCDFGWVMGNVNHQSVEEIWNGEKFQAIRKRMLTIGAEEMCSKNCLLINGMKDYQSFSWYNNLSKTSACYENALINEAEIDQGQIILKSKPRFMRLAISFGCNYKCYHCYQKAPRKQSLKLPAKFINEVKTLSQFFQFFLIFGGEPTLFPEFREMLKFGENFPGLKFATTTNASLIHNFFEEIAKVNWAFIAVSLDAASKETYERLRGSLLWHRVNMNLEALAEIKKQKGFNFTLSMTVNSKNYHEIWDFVVLALSYGAIPKINLVANPDGITFLKEYLTFSNYERKIILKQIEKISREFPEIFSQTGLNVLQRQITMYHKIRFANSLLRLATKVFPQPVQKFIKSTLRVKEYL
ncbi:MAG: radical SAM protein [Candidatus Riflebacteria bacterium]|nr:radical SAM protein [Candidatus Riflebacteria bacterium]